ncbi:CCR4-NOT transcription complex subunit 3 [Glycine soja]|uniref:CCR4-NOT transcription complex subunit 3 n=1 Tax=Glycine soja TaxID=3848 RepID=A0A445FET6_GLYSO|nr:CCR4-NOT transcription complex subunit 3 [Glycine soja]
MGASRKLQGEIDRVLKKVQEGVEVFDSIWNKVYDTDNANQKEKFEADLKKEIKKLQRYRDQIKTWIQSSEIKDKKVSASYEQALVDARKIIEREMERFKICEKETKTKAFSKEGLGQQPKTDPKEKAKSETRDWLNNVVGELESQIDNFEAELEGLSVKKGKSRPPRLTHLETSITRHKAHIKKCEFILRLLDNDELSPEEVNDVKDFLDDYVERNQSSVRSTMAAQNNSFLTSSFPSSISHKLDDLTLLLWRQQLIEQLELRIHHTKFGSNKIRCSSHGFNRHFQCRFCRVIGCVHSYEVWERIHDYFHKQTRAPARQLLSELRATTLGGRSMREFLMQIKIIFDSRLDWKSNHASRAC